MSEQRDEPTVRIALGGPGAAADDGATLLAARERAGRTRVLKGFGWHDPAAVPDPVAPGVAGRFMQRAKCRASAGAKSAGGRALKFAEYTAEAAAAATDD